MINGAQGGDGSSGSATRVVIHAVFWMGALLSSSACALDNTQLAVIINTADPLSVQIGNYYAAQRRILFQNIIKVDFRPGKTTLTVHEFDALKASIDRQVLPGVQAYALTWATPYRVDCMSITSALAFGFEPGFCADGCQNTRRSPYFNSSARMPFAQLHIRPTMSIAATSFAQAKALIDRGVMSDGSRPTATAYLLFTSDRARNVRSTTYPLIERLLGSGQVRARQLNQDALRDASDVLFYFTGKEKVEELQTLHFVPGAIADHLTSFGGMLTNSIQMSALRWLEAGATGSYGTVVEPCAIAQKFPNPLVVITYYLQGETLMEAYWKSVAMPGQGIFVGEPLAAPFRRKR
jgi:uncharacterized protein (TIGR03790 family)